MTTTQKVIKYLAIAFAVFLAVTIIGGILGAVGIIGIFFSGDKVTEDVQSYSVEGEIRSLVIEVHAADLYIEEGSAFSVESNLKNLKVNERNGRLTVKDTTKNKLFSSNSYEDAVLTICVPAGAVFENVNLIAGAGRVTVDALSAGTIGFELGAGEVSIDTLVAAKSADIEGGAGKITVADGSLHDLDLEMGLGQLNLTAALTGDCDLVSGIGEMNLTLLGSKEDYRLEFEKGIGSISVDGEDAAEYGKGGNGPNKVEIHGGIGAIRVDFEMPEAK